MVSCFLLQNNHTKNGWRYTGQQVVITTTSCPGVANTWNTAVILENNMDLEHRQSIVCPLKQERRESAQNIHITLQRYNWNVEKWGER